MTNKLFLVEFPALFSDCNMYRRDKHYITVRFFPNMVQSYLEKMCIFVLQDLLSLLLLQPLCCYFCPEL